MAEDTITPSVAYVQTPAPQSNRLEHCAAATRCAPLEGARARTVFYQRHRTGLAKIIPSVTLLVLACGAVTGCAVSKVEPLSIPLAYKANSKNAGALGGLSCAAIARIEVSDARRDKMLGIRTHESKPLKAEVTAGSDPASWVQDGVHGVLVQNNVTFQGNGPTLLISLDMLRTTESIWHRSSYEAQVAMTGELQSPSRKPCWKGTGVGRGGNYGYSGTVENYQETLNNALDAAILQMLQSQTFKDALCHCGM